MTNEGQLPMMKNMLNSAVKAGFPMSNFHCYILQENREAATYNTKEFQSITIRKLQVILSNLRMDREVIWIDNDIYLFTNMIRELQGIQAHLVMQDDLWAPCTGFFLARSTLATIRVINKSIDYLRSKSLNNIENDQHAFMRVYKSIIALKVHLLPTDQYPNGEIYFNQNQTANAKMVHSNFLGTTAEKVERFKSVNLWDESDVGFNQVNKYYI